MSGAAEEYLLQVALRRGWLTAEARASVARGLQRGGELFDLAQDHMSLEDLGALRRLSQAGGPGLDPRLVKRQDPLANSLDDESSQAMFASLAAGGDVVIDLGTPGAGKASAPARRDEIADAEPAPRSPSQAELLELLPFARGGMAVDLDTRPPAAKQAPKSPAPARPSLSPPPSQPAGPPPSRSQPPSGSQPRPQPQSGSQPRPQPQSGSQPRPQPAAPASELIRPVPAPDFDAADSVATFRLPADGMATIRLGLSGEGLPPPELAEGLATVNLGLSASSFPPPDAADGEVTVNLDMSQSDLPPPGDPRWESLGSAAYSIPPSGHFPGAPPSSGSHPAASTKPGQLPEAGGQIGPYRIERELARGGMGVVYVAEHTGLKRRVALKVLLPGSRDSQALARFQIEAEATARLDHPNVVRIFDVGQEAGAHYFAMDLIEGGTLQAKIRQAGRLEAREAAAITRKLADALAYAHSHAILHRDMKPANVLLREDGEPVVTDFGLAKDVKSEGLTVTGQVMGTPAYMPPEQADGEGERIDRRTDVYSIGATLYEMLTGQPPFRGESPLHVMRQVLNDAPIRPRALVRGLDRDLETICLKCLEKSPDQRYVSAGALGRDLNAYLKDLPIQARPPTPGEKLARWGRRNRKLMWALGGVGGALVLGGLWALVQVTEARVRGEVAREAGLKQGLAEAGARLAEEAKEGVTTKRRALTQAALPAAGAAPDVRQAALQRRVAAALELSTAAQRWRTLAAEDREAARACFEADMALGEATLAAEQWVLAAYAFERAQALGVDEARARRALAGVNEARTAEARARASQVEELLRQLEQGALAREEVVFGIVNRADEATLAIVVKRLERTIERMQAARRSLYLRDATPGETQELEPALDALDQRALADALEERYRRRLGESQRRIGGRAAAMGGAEVQVRFLDVLSGYLDATLGRQELVVARAACEALGWIQRPDPAVLAALDRYLAVEADPLRATAAGLALCRIGGDEAQRSVLAARTRFGVNSTFSAATQRALGQLKGEVALSSESAEGYAQRAHDLVAKGQPRQALADFDRALELNPNATSTLHGRGCAYVDLGEIQAGLRDFNRILELEPGHAAALNNRAQIRKNTGDLEGALADYEAAQKTDPQEAGFYVGHAQTLMAMGRYQEALRDGDEAVRVGPERPISWHLRGVTRSRMGDLQGAVSDLSRSIELDVTRQIPVNYSFRADAYLKLRRPRLALADVEVALELKPKDAQLWFTRGVAHAQLGDARAGLEDLSRSIELDPNRVDSWANRGAMRLAEGDIKGAQEDMTKALEFQPEAPQPWLNRAEIRIRLKDYEGALADVNACLEKARDPGSVPYLTRGRIHALRGDLEAARSDLGRFLLQAPEHPRAAEAQRILDQLPAR